MKNVKLRDSTGPKPDLTPQWFFTISYLQPTITVNFHHIWLFLNLQFPGGQSAAVQVAKWDLMFYTSLASDATLIFRIKFVREWPSQQTGTMPEGILM